MLEEIKEMIAETFDVDVEDLTEDTSFKDDLQADSLDLFELITDLEDKYNVDIPAEDLEDIQTIGDVERYMQNFR